MAKFGENGTVHGVGQGTEAAIPPRWMLGEMVGRSPAMERLFLQMRYLAHHLRVALVEGEPGTGKLLAARTLHALATGRATGFVPCSGPEFFRAGNHTAMLDDARGGTLYLTRIDTLTAEEQGKLLHLLEWLQHQHARNSPGAGAEHAPRQVLVSCEQQVRGLVLSGLLRADLSYHLTTVRLLLPPLRERREDLAPLVEHFLEQFARRHGKPLRGLGPGVLAHLLAHSWPGNVRELETTIMNGALMCEGQWIRMIDLPLLSLAAPDESSLGVQVGNLSGETLSDPRERQLAAAHPAEREPVAADPNLDRAILRHIRQVLTNVGGNKLRAARLLGISRSTLYRLLDTATVTTQQ